MMDTDVADTEDVTHEEWMQLNNVIQRIDSNVDAPSTKQESSPVSVIYMPLPVPVTHVYQATYILPLFIPYGMSPQQSAANMPRISNPICKRKVSKQSKDKLNRKRKVGERGKDKLGSEKKRRVLNLVVYAKERVLRLSIYAKGEETKFIASIGS